jgi:hypothetical protein
LSQLSPHRKYSSLFNLYLHVIVSTIWFTPWALASGGGSGGAAVVGVVVVIVVVVADSGFTDRAA